MHIKRRQDRGRKSSSPWKRQLVKGAHFQLLLVGALIGLISIIGGILVMAIGAPTATFGESVWWVFLRLSDPGYLGDE